MRKHMMGIGREMVEATNARLFGAMALGHAVSLFSPSVNGWVCGQITGIYLESGNHFGTLPRDFMVQLDSVNHQIYVRTAA